MCQEDLKPQIGMPPRQQSLLVCGSPVPSLPKGSQWGQYSERQGLTGHGSDQKSLKLGGVSTKQEGEGRGALKHIRQLDEQD